MSACWQGRQRGGTTTPSGRAVPRASVAIFESFRPQCRLAQQALIVRIALRPRHDAGRPADVDGASEIALRVAVSDPSSLAKPKLLLLVGREPSHQSSVSSVEGGVLSACLSPHAENRLSSSAPARPTHERYSVDGASCRGRPVRGICSQRKGRPHRCGRPRSFAGDARPRPRRIPALPSWTGLRRSAGQRPSWRGGSCRDRRSPGA